MHYSNISFFNAPYTVAVKKQSKDVCQILPLDAAFVNKNALQTIWGTTVQPSKHFALKRKPKAAAQRVELLQKCKKNNCYNKINICLSFTCFKRQNDFYSTRCDANEKSRQVLFNDGSDKRQKYG